MGLKDLKRRCLTENALVSTRQSRFLVHLADQFMTYRDINPLTNPDCRMTNGQYFVRYDAPSLLYENKRGDPKRPFTIGTDMVGFHLMVSGPKQFAYLAKTIPEIAWMVRNTNFNYRLFHIAKCHLGLCIPFCIDMARYEKKLLDQAKKEGLKDTMDFNAFISFRCALAREKDFEKTLPFPPTRDKYQKEINEMCKIEEHFETKCFKEYESEEETKWLSQRATSKNI